MNGHATLLLFIAAALGLAIVAVQTIALRHHLRRAPPSRASTRR
jgi:hypothetical protein